MLEIIYRDESVIRELRHGTLGNYIDGFVIYLQGLGYPHKALRFRFAVVRSLSKWLTKKNISLADLDEKRLAHFIGFRKKQTTMFLKRGDGKTLSLLVDYLRDEKIIPQSLPVKSENNSVERITQAYVQYLDEEKGLSASTIKRNKQVVHKFLIDQFGKERVIPKKITQNDVLMYISSFKDHYNKKTIQVMASVLRSFFRYLVMIGEIRVELTNCIPSIPSYRAAHLPVFLVKSETKQLLRTCDRRTTKGRRNYAILLLLLRLGLRASEVLNLSLDSINWELGELNIYGKGRKRRLLPLPSDVGSAIATYIRYARPKCLERKIFIRIRSPYRGLNNPSSISTIVRRALVAAGLKPQQMGAHLLRYTAAMETLSNGATLFEIGELLGHCSVDTTALYTKIDIVNLRELTQAWPIK